MKQDQVREHGSETGRAAMRAAAIAQPKRCELLTAPRPRPGPGAVLVRMEGCGLCASGLPVWQGREWFSYPVEPGQPGHEGWGRVEECGPGVTSVAPGQRVAVFAERAFAEYVTAGEQDVVALPPALEDRPFPGEPMACAVNVYRRCGIEPAQTVAVVGVGFLGALLVGLAARAGARVFALTRRESALRHAEARGAAGTFSLADPQQAVADVLAATGGNGCDRVIEATGEPVPLQVASDITRTRGRLIVAGYHQDGLRQINMQVWNWKGLDVINAHERDVAVYRRGLREAVDLAERGCLDPFSLITHRFGLDQLDEAFATMEQRPEGFIKAWIRIPQ